MTLFGHNLCKCQPSRYLKQTQTLACGTGSMARTRAVKLADGKAGAICAHVKASRRLISSLLWSTLAVLSREAQSLRRHQNLRHTGSIAGGLSCCAADAAGGSADCELSALSTLRPPNCQLSDHMRRNIQTSTAA